MYGLSKSGVGEIETSSETRTHPARIKWWFWSWYGSFNPSRTATRRVIGMCLISGLAFCLLSLWERDAIWGGVLMLGLAAIFAHLIRLGDRHALWSDQRTDDSQNGDASG